MPAKIVSCRWSAVGHFFVEKLEMIWHLIDPEVDLQVRSDADLLKRMKLARKL